MAHQQHQAGARHLADVAGTFADPEWAPQVKAQPQPKAQDDNRVYPLWVRATMDPDTERRLLELLRSCPA